MWDSLESNPHHIVYYYKGIDIKINMKEITLTHLSPTRIPGKTSSDMLWTLRGILGPPDPKVQSPVQSFKIW